MVVNPAYQQLHSVAKAIGCDVALWTLRDDGGFRFDLDDLRALATPGTRMIVINTPHNPTGAMLSEQELQGDLRSGGGARRLGPERRGLPLARSPGESAPRPADAKSRSAGDQHRHVFEALRPARFAHRLDRGAGGRRAPLLGAARLHQSQPRQAERRASGPCLSPSRPDRRAHAADRRRESRRLPRAGSPRTRTSSPGRHLEAASWP